MPSKLPFKVNFALVETEQALLEAIEYLETKEVISIDTETTGLDPYLSRVLLIQIADIDKCFVFDCSKIDVMKLKPLLENEKTLKILQNAKFDYKAVKAGYGIKIRNMFCTMSAERLINAGRAGSRASLKALVSKYLGITIDKEIRKQFVETSGYQRDGFSEDELEYAANDALILFPIYEQQVTELIDRALVEVAILEFSVIEVTAEMELAGVSINTHRWREIIDQVKERRDETHKLLLKEFASVVNQNNLFGLPIINTNSPVQVLSYLKKLGVKTKEGKELPSTDESILSQVKDKYKVVELLLDYKGDEKIVSTYGLPILDKINPKTNRLHAEFDQLRAATGRYGSRSPNLQNIPAYFNKSKFFEGDKVLIKEEEAGDLCINTLGPYTVSETLGTKDNRFAKLEGTDICLPFKSLLEYPVVDFRSCFVAPPGKKLITADYSQQEVRILADSSGDPVFAEAYRNNEDIHTKTAAGLFGVPLDKVTKDQRKKSKTINFALIYGAGPWKISKSLDISEDEAKELIDRYFKTYPGIKKFLHGMSDFAVRNGYAYTISGRKRYFSIPDGSHPDYKKIIGSIRRQAPNTFVQGSAADVTKQALVYVYKEIEQLGLDIKILLIVHDEIVLEADERDAVTVSKMLEDCMIRGFSTYFKSVPMKVDAVIEDFWSKD